MESEAENLKQQGNQQFKLQNYAQAIRHYEGALQLLKSSNNVTLKTALQSNLALCLTKQNRMEDALYYCEEALTLQPDYEKVIYRKATILSEMKKIAEAVTFLAGYIQTTQNAALITLYNDLRAKLQHQSQSDDNEVFVQVKALISEGKLISSNLLQKFQSCLYRKITLLKEFAQTMEQAFMDQLLATDEEKQSKRFREYSSFLLKIKALLRMKNIESHKLHLLQITYKQENKAKFMTQQKIQFMLDYLGQQTNNLSSQQVKQVAELSINIIEYCCSSSSSDLKQLDKLLLIIISFSKSFSNNSQVVSQLTASIVKNMDQFQRAQDLGLNSNLIVFAKKQAETFEESLIKSIKYNQHHSQLQMLLLTLINPETAVTLINEINYLEQLEAEGLDNLKLLNTIALQPAFAKLLLKSEIVQSLKVEGPKLLTGTITRSNLLKLSVLVKLRVQTTYIQRDLPKLLTHLAHQEVNPTIIELMTFLCLMSPDVFKQQSIALLPKYVDSFGKIIETGQIYQILNFLCIMTRGQTFKHYPTYKMRAAPGVEGSSAQKEEFKEVVRSIQGGKDVDFGSEASATIVRSSFLQNTNLSKTIHLILKSEHFKQEQSSKIFRPLMSELLLNLSFTQSCKRRMMQQGLIPVLIELKEKNNEFGKIDAAQALARCFINTEMQGVSLAQMQDSVRFLFDTLIGKNMHELLIFEGCLALTNLSAYDSSIRQKLFGLNGASSFQTIFDLLFEQNQKVSRAGLELLANLSIQIDEENEEKYLKNSYLSSVLAHLHHSDQLVVFAALSFIANVVHLSPTKHALLHQKEGAYILALLNTLLKSQSETFLQRVVHIFLNLDQGEEPLVLSKYVRDREARLKMKEILLTKVEKEECMRGMIPWIQNQM